MKKQVQAPTYLEKLEAEFEEFRKEREADGETEITGMMIASFFRYSASNIEMIREEILDADQSDKLIAELLRTGLSRYSKGYVYRDLLEEILADFTSDDLKDMCPAHVIETLKTDPTADIQDTIDKLMDYDPRLVFEAIENYKKYRVAI